LATFSLMTSWLPDHYAVLDISTTSTATQIRDAYRRKALLHHPDRIPPPSSSQAPRGLSESQYQQQKAEATKVFQYVNDAFQTLSDAKRRREYDLQRSKCPPHLLINPLKPPSSSSKASSTPSSSAQEAEQTFFYVFGKINGCGCVDSFVEDLLSSELPEDGQQPMQQTSSWGIWGNLGGMSGAIMGFIVANVPGAVAGELILCNL
jgi:curved DNA-binding protein CbpA